MNLKRLLPSKRRLLIYVTGLLLLLPVWVYFNPLGRFGYCRFGFTVFGAVPYPGVDIQVRSDGKSRIVEKTHALTFERIGWLLESKPSVLIVATGWDGVTRPEEKILSYKDCELVVLQNEEAIRRYNEYKRSGKQVSIHYHSTC